MQNSSNNHNGDLALVYNITDNSYQGLFNYINNQFEYASTQLNSISDDVYETTFYNGNGVFNGTLQNIDNLSIDEVKRRINLYDNLSYLELNENVTSMFQMFTGCFNLFSIPNFNTTNVTNTVQMFNSCTNLVNIPEFNTSNIVNMSGMFSFCNNLSDASIQNIINMCLNSNITEISIKNLSNVLSSSPFANTNIDNSKYQNRWAELDAAGWTY